jgi:hypothetical protein
MARSIVGGVCAAASLALLWTNSAAAGGVSPGGQFVATSIGVAVGNITAQQVAAQREAACMAGTPASATEIANETSRVGRVMAAYFALTPKAGEHAIGRVFAADTTGVRWRDAAGPASLDHLAEHLIAFSEPPVMTALVVGGDGLSARGLWTATSADVAKTQLVIAADFTVEGHMFDYARGVRVLHMAVLPASQAPAPPTPFCHLPTPGY